ncbi:hypothetical protein KSS87_023038, partial [Heliosperma pusillum]
MFQGVMSNSTLSEEAANNLSSFNPLLLQNTTTINNNNNNNINNNSNNNNIISSPHQQQSPIPKKVKKRRNLPGNPDPDAEVIALSPKSLLATNRFICEICNKGFQRDQNLQLHRRGHNLPWKLKQRNKLEIVRKKAYVCPEPSCVHHHPSRALGDLTGIKKHFCRKHGEKKFKCEKCSKIYAVHSDWKAHSKTCGTREYRCDCGTLFSRKDSFITHRAFCDALAEESARLSTNPFSNPIFPPPPQHSQQPMPPPSSPFAALSATQHHPSSLFPFPSSSISLSSSPWDPPPQNPNNPNNHHNHLIHIKTEINNHPFPPPQQQQPPQSYFQPPPLFTKSMLTSPPFTSDTNTITAHFLSATALLQKATAVGATLQQSQQSQQAQAMQPMLNHGFDELGPSFCNVGQQQQQQQQPSTTTTDTTNVSNIDYHHHLTMGMVGSGDFKFATWRKDEDTTRDFLGLTAGDHYTPNNNNNNNTNTNSATTTNNNNNNISRSEGGFVVNDDEDDDMEGNMLKFTGGLQYGMTTTYNRDNSSPSSSSLVHHHHHHHGEGSF